jgi:SAM-dependent methyltransferase
MLDDKKFEMNIDKEIQENNYFDYRNVDASFYDTVVPHWIKFELESKDVTILDYGCGFGQTLLALRNEGYNNIYGVDIETNAINHCIQKDLNVKKLDLNDLQNPFDIIILTHVIEHCPKDQIINTLSCIRNEFLNTNGKLLLAVPNAQSNTGSYWAYEDWTHSTIFTSGSIYYVLKAAGFNSVEFLDIDCTLGTESKIKKIIKKFLLKIYILNKIVWNKVTNSSYHEPSPQIFSYEIKCKAY